MDHVAIDLGSRLSQVCVRSEDGEIKREYQMATKALSKVMAQWPPSRVVVETAAGAFAMADAALGCGHQVRVVPATLVRSLGVGSRGIKTDRRDARILSEVSTRIDLPSVHVPSHHARECKSLCGMREALVESRTKLINTVRGWLRGRTEQIRRGAAKGFAQRVCDHFQRKGQLLPAYVQRQLDAIDQLSAHIHQADGQLKTLANSTDICRRLMSVPGVGPVTAVRYVAAIDDRERFCDAHQVESYIGLTPGEHASSLRKRRTGITKAGAPRLRWALLQAAWVLRRRRPLDPIVLWSRQIEKRRGKFIAVVALARKMAGVMYAMWRDGTCYDPQRAAQVSAAVAA